jgi:hypothetical protein
MNLNRFCAAALLCLLGVLITGCSKTPVLVVTFDPANDESGWYPIDVAVWHQDPVTNEWYYTETDATADLQAYVLDATTGGCDYTRTIILDSYTVKWTLPDGDLPRTNGLLAVSIPSTPDDSRPSAFTILVFPALAKDTTEALKTLLGDPENNSTLHGQLVVPAEIHFTAHDVLSGEELTASMAFTATFADYPNPNTYH